MATPAWTNPKTWATSDALTAAVLNTHIRDNELFLFTPPRCRVYGSADAAISNTTVSALFFDSSRYDDDGVGGTMHSNVTNNARITPHVAGVYTVKAHVLWDVNAAGNERTMEIAHNNTTVIARVSQRPLTAVYTSQICETDWMMAVNDWFTVRVYHDAGGPLLVKAFTAHSPEFSAVRVSG